MEQYKVTGMSCAACVSRVEKAVNAVEGVSSCSVSLLTNSMAVEGTASKEAVIKAVSDAGYGAFAKNELFGQQTEGLKEPLDELKDEETPKLKKRLIASLVFLLALMYMSMGHMMFDFPLPYFMAENHVMMGIIQMFLAAIVMVINQKFFINGFKGLIHRSPNMDTLVAMGSAASFLYSFYALLAMSDACYRGDSLLAACYMDEFYFESAAMILTLITVGKMLEARAKGKTTDALKGLMRLAPEKATILKDGTEIEVPIQKVQVGDIFVVRPGESIPVDGTVLEGISAVNESALTGESIPVDKFEGDFVSAATINKSGFLKCEANRVGSDTTLSKIIEMVSDAAATKAPIAKIADRVSGIFVPAVITVAILTFAVWMIVGESLGFSLARAISVLVISCPCALGLATPVAIMVGNGMGAKHGILFKTAVSLEQTGKTEIVVLDKTGTITVGEPKVTDIYAEDEVKLLQYAYAIEKRSEHPLSKAIVSYVEERGDVFLSAMESVVSDFLAIPGKGLEGKVKDKMCYAGNKAFVSAKVFVSDAIFTRAEQYANEGKTPLFFAAEDMFLGLIAVADPIKEDAKDAIDELKNMGISVVMLTGDNTRTAAAIGREAGVDHVIAGVLPDGKERYVRSLQEYGKVMMVGDGINDAPALTKADVGVAIGAGTDIAIDAADVVLMKSRLKDVPASIRMSRATLRNIHENLFWAFFYNVIGIPLAAGVWYPLLGLKLNPMFGAAAMSLSSFCVVSNALRLNLVRLYDHSKDKKINEIKFEIKEENMMKKTVNITGMMCPHCEATVKKALEALDGVESAAVSHETGKAVLTLSKDVEESLLKKAVEDKDFTVTGFEV